MRWRCVWVGSVDDFVVFWQVYDGVVIFQDWPRSGSCSKMPFVPRSQCGIMTSSNTYLRNSRDRLTPDVVHGQVRIFISHVPFRLWALGPPLVADQRWLLIFQLTSRSAVIKLIPTDCCWLRVQKFDKLELGRAAPCTSRARSVNHPGGLTELREESAWWLQNIICLCTYYQQRVNAPKVYPCGSSPQFFVSWFTSSTNLFFVQIGRFGYCMQDMKRAKVKIFKIHDFRLVFVRFP